MKSFQIRFYSVVNFCIVIFLATFFIFGAKSVAIGQVSAQPPNSRASRSLGLPITAYFDPTQGMTSISLIRKAVDSNSELVATRIDLERARARLRQAGLRPNPTLDFEQAIGTITGSSGERATNIGFALPLEIGGKRQRRIELAQTELMAVEAEIADRERRLVADVSNAHAEALSVLYELQITDDLQNIDKQTSNIVEVRVKEGESAQLEMNLLLVEVDRLRSRRPLIEARLQAVLLRLKTLTGILPNEPLLLKENIATLTISELPVSLEESIEMAMHSRPDLRLARLNEEVAQANLRLARTQATPEVTLSAKYSFDRSITDLPPPLVALPDKTKTLSFGVSIGLPILNKNQGAIAEAVAAVTQAQRRREFIEQIVRAEVSSAYTRYEAVQAAISIFKQGVITRSLDNIGVIREAYKLGAYRITDLLAEQRKFIDSQREFTEVLTERYRAVVDLQTAIGIAIQ